MTRTLASVVIIFIMAVNIVSGQSPNAISSEDGAIMVLIPAGEFQMGSDVGYSDERPIHTVYVYAFYMDAYEVTNELYGKFMDDTGHRAPAYWYDSKYNALDQPVVGVSWYDAKAYCDWAGKRLPTEAEWEKAARGGLAGNEYPWGNNLTHDDANYNGVGGMDVWDRSAPVGSFAPNGYGLYDVAGNAAEWCADWYNSSYYVNSPYQNPKGPDSGSSRVLRGGSWGDSIALRVAFRNNYTWPTQTHELLGFRCVLLANQPPNRPINISPPNNEAGISLTWTVISTPFSDPDAGDTLTAAQWQFTITSGNYSAPVYDNGELSVSGTDSVEFPLSVANLDYGTKYYWRVRYKDNHGAWSEWSQETCFTTFSPEFTFAHITDVHMGWAGYYAPSSPGSTPPYLIKSSAFETFARTLRDISNLPPSKKPKFVLITGDNVEYNQPQWFEQFIAVISIFNIATNNDIPVYVVPGNHDRRERDWPTIDIPPLGDDGLKNYHAIVTGSDYKKFNESGYLFIGLDSGGDDLHGGELLEELLEYSLIHLGPEGTGLTNGQMDYLDNLDNSDKEKPKIIFMHHPVFTGKLDIGNREDSAITGHRDDFIKYCKEKDNKVKLVLSGHTHQNHIFNSYDQEVISIGTSYPYFIQTASASKDRDIFSHGYRLITIDGNTVDTEYRTTEILPENLYLSYTKGPATLNVYDSQGRHTGYGSVITDIPDSYYTGYYDAMTTQEIVLYNTSEVYTYQVEGVGEGSYTLDVAFIKDGESALFTAIDIPITSEGLHQYIIDRDNLSEDDGVTIKIDADGDHTFEETLNTGSIFARGETFSIGLDAGWNLVSIPFDVKNSNITSIMERVEGLYESIWTYDNQIGWKQYIPNGPKTSNNIEFIEQGRGYLFYMNNPATLLIAGQKLTMESIQLFKGWNLVGYNSLTPLSVEIATAYLPYGTIIYAYDGELKTWLRYVVGNFDFLNSFSQLEPGKGYWIWVEQDCVWDTNSQ